MQLLSFLLLILHTGCIAEDEPAGEKGDITGNEFPVKVTLQMPSASTPGTRAISEIDENRVENINVLAFKADESKPSGWKLAYRAQGTSIADQPGDNPGKARKRFVVNLIKDETGQQLLVMLANVHSQLERMGNIRMGMDKDELLGSLVFENATGWSTPAQEAGDDPFIPFPMWGEVSVRINDATTHIDGVNLLRGIARVDVLLADAVSDFVLDEVYVYNSKSKGRIVPDTACLDGGTSKVKSATVPTGVINNHTPLKYVVPAGMERLFERSIYLFEAKGVAIGNASQATCLVVGGTYRADGKTTYYRVNPFEKDLLRNHRYRIYIMDVSGSGYNTPQEAFEANTFNMESETKEWDDSDITDIAFDSQYILGVGPGVLSLPHKAFIAAGAENRLSVYTDYPRGWSVAKISDTPAQTSPANWLSVQNATTGEAMAKKNLWLKLEENRTTSERTAYILITAGRLQYTVTVKQEVNPDPEQAIVVPRANCYMLQPGGTPILIPVSRANSDGVEERIGADDVYTVDLLWTDHPGGVKAVSNKPAAAIDQLLTEGQGKNGYIRVRPGTEEGNAVIAVKVNGEVKWSWHIWITAYAAQLYDDNYQPFSTSGGTNTHNGYVFMDRHLGALTGYTSADMAVLDYSKTGMLYQWGRKDPTPTGTMATNVRPALYRADGTSSTSLVRDVNGVGSLAQSIKNPTWLYYSTEAANWYGSRSDYLWNTTGNLKTVYDPCPRGWRVPIYKNNMHSFANSPWKGVELWPLPGWDNGRTWTSFGYYPASGYWMGGTTGGIKGIGTYIYSRSATINGNNSAGLCSPNNGSSPQPSGTPIRRDLATPVRCVKE